MQIIDSRISENLGKPFAAENRTYEKNMENQCPDTDRLWTNVQSLRQKEKQVHLSAYIHSRFNSHKYVLSR